MILYLTFQAYRHKTHGLMFEHKVAEKFDKKVAEFKVSVADVREYVWSIERVVIKQQENLLSLSESCKIALYIMFFGDNYCFDLNKCSFIAANVVFEVCCNRNIGIILNSPYLINTVMSPNYIMHIDFEGVHTSAKVETPFELFSAGVKDLCHQLEEVIETPILMAVYDEVLQTVTDINQYAETLKQEEVKSIDQE